MAESALWVRRYFQEICRSLSVFHEHISMGRMCSLSFFSFFNLFNVRGHSTFSVHRNLFDCEALDTAASLRLSILILLIDFLPSRLPSSVFDDSSLRMAHLPLVWWFIHILFTYWFTFCVFCIHRFHLQDVQLWTKYVICSIDHS